MTTQSATRWTLLLTSLALLALPSWGGSQPDAPTVRPVQFLQTVPPGAVLPTSPAPPLAGFAGPPAPQVTLRVHVPSVVMPGKELRYRIVVANPTQSPAHHVLVRCKAPSNARYLRSEPKENETTPEYRWKLGTLAAGARQEIVLDVMPNGEGDIKLCARVMFEHGQCVQTRLGRSSLNLQIAGPKETVQYDIATYRITVTNTGQTSAEEVVLSETLPPELEFSSSKPSPTTETPLSWKLGTLAPGQSKQVECQLIAKKAGTLVHRAEVRDTTGRVHRAEATLVIGAPKLTITKTGPERQRLDTPTTYEIVVSNRGTLAVTNVIVTDVLPKQLEFLSATAGGRLANEVVRWNLGTLVPGSQRKVSLTLQSKYPGELINRATVQADRGLSDRAEARTVFEGSSGLAVEVDRKEGILSLDQKTTFTVHIFNRGDGEATNLELGVTVSPELKIIEAKGASVARLDGQKINFAVLPTLAPKGEAKYTIEVEGKTAGSARLSVDLRADQLSAGPVRAVENIRVIGE